MLETLHGLHSHRIKTSTSAVIFFSVQRGNYNNTKNHTSPNQTVELTNNNLRPVNYYVMQQAEKSEITIHLE